MKKLIEKLETLDDKSLLEFWKGGFVSEETIGMTKEGLKKIYKDLPEALDKMPLGYILGNGLYTEDSERFMITLIGKIGDYSKFNPKYLPYEALVRSMYKAGRISKDQFIKVVNDKSPKDTGDKDCFFIRLIGGSRARYNSDPLMKPSIQVYPFKLEDLILEQIRSPFHFNGLEVFMGDDVNFQTYNIQEVEENIEKLIKEQFKEKPIYGTEKIESL